MPAQTAPHNPLTWILPLSAGLAAFLLWLPYGKPAATTADWMTILPATNALFNALSACCLIGGFLNIRRGNRAVHIRFMLAAVVCSAFFLVGYIVHHHFHGDTLFSWPRLYSTNLLRHPDQPHCAVRYRPADGVDDAILCRDSPVPDPPQDCPLYVSDLAVRLGHRRGCISLFASLHLEGQQEDQQSSELQRGH